jgi:hypothetical protein
MVICLPKVLTPGTTIFLYPFLFNLLVEINERGGSIPFVEFVTTPFDSAALLHSVPEFLKPY